MNEEAVSIWIRRAESDLKIGKDELGTEESATDAVCFHMQQCVEKYLKAFLVFRGQEFPRSHDIALLVSLCSKIDAEFARLTERGIDAVLQLMDKYPKGYCLGCFLLLRPALALRPVTSDLHRRHFPPNWR
jgi:HEPN domain-containing protein